jgi:hypothetical protein
MGTSCLKELLEYAEEGCSPQEFLDRLTSFPKELEDIFKFILQRLERGNSRSIAHGIRLFQFVLFAVALLPLSNFSTHSQSG